MAPADNNFGNIALFMGFFSGINVVPNELVHIQTNKNFKFNPPSDGPQLKQVSAVK
jgi:hypothetical protein